jgi:hypothetical protein
MQLNAPTVSSEFTPYYFRPLRIFNRPKKFDPGFLQQYYALESGLRGENIGDWARYIAAPIAGWAVNAADYVGALFGAERGAFQGFMARNLGLYSDPTGLARTLAYGGRRIWGEQYTDDPRAAGELAARTAREVSTRTAGINPGLANLYDRVMMAAGYLNYDRRATSESVAGKMSRIRESLDESRRTIHMSAEQFSQVLLQFGPQALAIATPGTMRLLQRYGAYAGYGGQQRAYMMMLQFQQQFGRLMPAAGARQAGADIVNTLAQSRLVSEFGQERIAGMMGQMIERDYRDPRMFLTAAGLTMGAESIREAQALAFREYAKPGGRISLFTRIVSPTAAREAVSAQYLREIYMKAHDIKDFDVLLKGPGRNEAIQELADAFDIGDVMAAQLVESLAKEEKLIEKTPLDWREGLRRAAVALPAEQVERLSEIFQETGRKWTARDVGLAKMVEAIGKNEDYGELVGELAGKLSADEPLETIADNIAASSSKLSQLLTNFKDIWKRG